jgi:hypothetical protein
MAARTTVTALDIQRRIARCAPDERVAIVLWALAQFDTAGDWNEGCTPQTDDDFVEMMHSYDSADHKSCEAPPLELDEIAHALFKRGRS